MGGEGSKRIGPRTRGEWCAVFVSAALEVWERKRVLALVADVAARAARSALAGRVADRSRGAACTASPPPPPLPFLGMWERKRLLDCRAGRGLQRTDRPGHVAVSTLAPLTHTQKPFHHAEIHDPELARISQPPRFPFLTSVSFSNNGDFILIGTSSNVHYILDAFTLHLHCRLEGHVGLERDARGAQDITPRRGGSGEEVCWTSDSRWVLSGSRDGLVYGWNLSSHPRDPDADGAGAGGAGGGATTATTTGQREAVTLHPTVKLKNVESASASAAPSRAVRFSPRYGVMAVGGDEMVSLERGRMGVERGGSGFGWSAGDEFEWMRVY